MSEITREGYIKLAIMSTDVKKKKKGKIQNEQLTWDLKKKKINKRTNQRMKKKIHAELVTVEKIFKK